MSLDSFVSNEEQLSLGDVPVTIKPITLRQLFRLLALVDKVKGDLGLTQEEIKATELNAKGISELVTKVVQACVGTVDFDAPTYELTGTSKLVCNELGALVGVKGDDVADAPLDDLTEVVSAFWEANARGPLGQKVRSTIAKLAPMIRMAKDVLAMGFQKELMQDLHVGGITGGGMTGFSSLSFESLAGLNDTSSTTSPPDESSSSTPPSPSTESSKQPPTETSPEAPAATPEPAESAPSESP